MNVNGTDVAAFTVKAQDDDGALSSTAVQVNADVADENDPTVQMQHILKAMGQKNIPDFKPILEVNPAHEIIRRLAESNDDSLIEDASLLLLEQAMLIEGVELASPGDFVKRLNRVMEKAL